MAVNPANSRRTMYDVTWNAYDLGGLDDAKLDLAMLLAAIKIGSLGNVKVGDRFIGLTDDAKITLILRETIRATIQKLVPWATQTAGAELVLTPPVNTDLYTYAQPLILHPRDRTEQTPSTDQDIELYKTVPISGEDFEIFGPGDVTLTKVLAAKCVGGGPHIECSVRPGLADAQGARHFNFTVSAETVADATEPDDTQPASRRSVATGPDGLRVITWSGELVSDDLGGAFTALLKSFRDLYKLPTWVVSYEFQEGGDGHASFTLAATEMREGLPQLTTGDGEAATDGAVDGQASFRVERSEQMELIKTYAYELVVVGDVEQILAMIRPEGHILRESVDVQRYGSQRLRALFVTLEGGDGSALMAWNASLHYEQPEAVYDVRYYPGVQPVLIRRPATMGRLTFSGSATCAGVFLPAPRPPASLFMIDQPRVTHTRVNAVEFRVDWQYVVAVDPTQSFVLPITLLNRPSPQLVPTSPLAKSKPRHPPPLPTPPH